MLLAAITAYSVSVFIHVTAVVVGFGATFAEAVMFPVAQKLDPRHLPYVHRLQLAINRRLATPALLVVIVTGIYQVSEGDWSFGDPWISVTFLIVIVIGGLLGAYFVPSDRRLGAQVERDLAETGAPSESYLAGARKQGAIGGLTGFLLVLAIFLMVTKPGA
ncbi:MAG TPA: DUF2269 family protein [Solirubrobacteraceae bacterium]|jgi:uncharacterized membrane protein|nr:DUF2269 family protein [Solirubrobacteraceae bacterium]